MPTVAPLRGRTGEPGRQQLVGRRRDGLPEEGPPVVPAIGPTVMPIGGPIVHANAVGASAPGGAAGAASEPTTATIRTALGTLLAGHILHDGETVLLLLKPSRWFIVVTSLGFIGLVLALLIIATLAGMPPGPRHPIIAELAFLALLFRLVWATFQWVGRVYVLTDLRILRLSGAFNVELFDCPLRKVKGVRRADGLAERLLGLGTIDVVPQDPGCSDGAPGAWQMVRKPAQVHDQIVAALNRAQQGM